MTSLHPIRVADAAATTKLDPITLEAMVKRTVLALGPSESLGDITQASGEIALAVAAGSLGQLFFYDSTDTTTADDGLTVLVDASGHRYKLEDSATVAVSSVISETNTPAVGPSIADAYIVGTAPTGAWAANAKDIAVYTRRGWVFVTPAVGHTVLNKATDTNVQFVEAGTWSAFVASIGNGTNYPVSDLFPLGVSVEAEQNAPPGSPTNGVHYLTGTSPTGAWAGHASVVAYYKDSAWAFLTNYGGARIYNKTTYQELQYNATTGTWLPVWPIAGTCQFRLTLQSNTPVPTADQTAKATLYLTPYKGKSIALYVSGGWVLRTTSQISISLSGYTTGKPYDVFVYDNAGTPTLETLVWTNDSTRATGLTTQDGVLVKSGDATRLYVGTIYTSATGQCEDSLTKRYVWNYYNRVRRAMRRYDTTDSWTYTTATVRQARANSSNQLDFVIGFSEDGFEARLIALGSNSSTGTLTAGIGYDSSTAIVGMSSQVTPSSQIQTMTGFWSDIPAAGKHTLYMLEYSTASGTSTWYGDNGASLIQSGINAMVLG